MGTWNNRSGLVKRRREKRNDFFGWTLVAGMVLIRIEVNEALTPDNLTDIFVYPNTEPMTRYTLRRYLDLRRPYNFTYKYRVERAWTVGKSFDKGLTGLITRGDIDVSVSSWLFRKDRLQVMAYASYFLHTEPSFLFIQPSLFGTWTALFQPFSNHLWLGLGASLVVLSLLVWFISSRDDASTEQGLFNSALFVLSHISQQGSENVASKLSSYIIFFTIYCYTFMMLNYYNAAVLDGILSPVSSPIKNERQLIDSDMRVGVADFPYFRDMSESGFWGKRTKLRADLETKMRTSNSGKHDIFFSVSDYLRLFLTENFAIMEIARSMFTYVWGKLTNSQICNMKVIEYDTPPNAFGHASSKNSPYHEFFAQRLHYDVETGSNNREMIQFIRRFIPTCIGSQEYVTIGIKAVTPAFGILAAGILISAVLLVAETLIFTLKKNKHSGI